MIKKTTEGFSLIEVLVATFIFVLVIFSAMVIFSDTLGVKRQAESFQLSQESAYYPVEIIARDVRDAASLNVTPSLQDCASGIIITKDSGQKVCYFKDSDRVAYKTYLGSYWSTLNYLTPESVKVNTLTFSGVSSPSTKAEADAQTIQPYATITANIETNQESRSIDKINLDIQTTATLLDYNWKYKDY